MNRRNWRLLFDWSILILLKWCNLSLNSTFFSQVCCFSPVLFNRENLTIDFEGNYNWSQNFNFIQIMIFFRFFFCAECAHAVHFWWFIRLGHENIIINHKRDVPHFIPEFKLNLYNLELVIKIKYVPTPLLKKFTKYKNR